MVLTDLETRIVVGIGSSIPLGAWVFGQESSSVCVVVYAVGSLVQVVGDIDNGTDYSSLLHL